MLECIIHELRVDGTIRYSSQSATPLPLRKARPLGVKMIRGQNQYSYDHGSINLPKEQGLSLKRQNA